MFTSEQISPMRYLMKRFYRLYPMYFISVLLIFICVSAFGLPGRETNALDLLLNLLFVNGFIGTPYIDSAHWYMTYTVSLCVFAAFCMLIKQHKDNKALLVLMIYNISMRILSKILPLPIIARALQVLSGGGYIYYLLIGLALSYIKKDTNTTLIRKLFNYAVIFICLLKLILTNGFMCTGLFIIVLALLLGAIYERCRFLENEFFLFVGEISFVLYLIHQNIGYIIENVLIMHGVPVWIAVVFSIIIVLILAYVINFIFKKMKKIRYRCVT